MDNPNASKKTGLTIELIVIVILCVIAIAIPFAAVRSILKPENESVASWFQRSGAVTSIFAIYCQLRINNFLEKIRGGTFRESWYLYEMFAKYQSAISYAVTIIAVIGALVWGYGDLLLNRCQSCSHHANSNQN